jgi:hypothetical protein
MAPTQSCPWVDCKYKQMLGWFRRFEVERAESYECIPLARGNLARIPHTHPDVAKLSLELGGDRHRLAQCRMGWLMVQHRDSGHSYRGYPGRFHNRRNQRIAPISETSRCQYLVAACRRRTSVCTSFWFLKRSVCRYQSVYLCRVARSG